MTQPLRAYQETAIATVERKWASGTRRVCLVAPTGSGKSVMGVSLIARRSRAEKWVWLTHRDTLITQSARHLRDAGLDVGIVSPNHPPDPWAPVQVASIDTLVSRGVYPPADGVIFDECHHAMAATYRAVYEHYTEARTAGLTATPQRRDGKPLGDAFDAMVVAARYSELIAAGHIVGCRVFRPNEALGSDLAQSPLDAWRGLERRNLDGPCFAFAGDVKAAGEHCATFNAAGVASALITGTTRARVRAEYLDAFRDGRLRVLWNVHVLTEGVDVPDAAVCLLASGASHAANYLQKVGRVLRVGGASKLTAVLLDLPGVSHLLGLPTADREYALDGRPIRVVGEPLKNCPQCGATIPSAENPCSCCGYAFERAARKLPRIWDLELAEAIEAAGGDPAIVGDAVREKEFSRLLALVKERGWEEKGLRWAVAEWRKLFGEDTSPPMRMVPDEMKRAELGRLSGVAAAKGFKRGWVSHRFRAMFGHWPTHVPGV